MNQYWNQNQQPPDPAGQAAPAQIPYGVPHAAPSPQMGRKKRGWIVPLVTGLGGLILGVGIGGAGGDDAPQAVPASTVTATVQASAPSSEVTVTAVSTVTATATVTAAPAEAVDPEPDPAPQPVVASEPQTATEGVPAEWRTALSEAQDYVDLMPFSRAGLLDQLTSEYGGQYPDDAAQYAVDNVVADWNEEALEAAISYRETIGMSNAALHDQLTSEYGSQFTQEEADYALANLPE